VCPLTAQPPEIGVLSGDSKAEALTKNSAKVEATVQTLTASNRISWPPASFSLSSIPDFVALLSVPLIVAEYHPPVRTLKAHIRKVSFGFECSQLGARQQLREWQASVQRV